MGRYCRECKHAIRRRVYSLANALIPVKAGMIENPEEYPYGSLWFIRHRQFDLVEPPDQYLLLALPDFVTQLLISN